MKKKCDSFKQISRYNKKIIDNFSSEIALILEKLKNNVRYYLSIIL